MITVLLSFTAYIAAGDITTLEHGGKILSVEFHPTDSSKVASASDDNTIKLWDLDTGLATTFNGHTDKVNAIAFSPDGLTLASGSSDKTFKLWRVSDQQVTATLEHFPFEGEPVSTVTSVAFDPDGKTLATAGYRTVKLWDISDNTVSHTFEHDHWAAKVVFSPNGSYLAVIHGQRKKIKIWDVATKQSVTDLTGDVNWISYIAFSPDSTTFVDAGIDSVVTLRLTSDWSVIGRISVYGSVSGLDFSPDGKTLASASREISLWSVETGEPIVSLTNHDNGVEEVAFSSDGETLASSEYDGGVLHVQDVGTLIDSRPPPDTVRLIYFLPSDRVSQPDIDTKLDELIKRAQQVFAGQMEHHRFGRKTFQFETDATGKAVVHHVKGKFKDKFYQNQSRKVWEEIEARFDISKNIYLTALDVSTEVLDGFACGYGGSHGAIGGTALIPASGRCFEEVDVTVHELGHAFGLDHDFRNDLKPWIDSYSTEPMTTSACAARWLDAHRYFNRNTTYFNEPTAVEIWPPRMAESEGLRLRFEITDFNGLHQVQLFSTVEYENALEFGILGCKSLSGSRAIAEFITTQLTAGNDTVVLRVIDTNGNFSERKFPIDTTSVPAYAEDVNGDGVVNIQDLVQIAANFEEVGQNIADVNEDGIVNIQDLVLVAGALGKGTDTPATGSIH